MIPPDGPDAGLPLAAILAGGRSRRFGSPKALARVGGVPLIERVRDALTAVVPDPVLVTRSPGEHAWLGLPSRADAVASEGPLAGILTALRWAEELGRNGTLVAACDLPFLDAALLRAIVERARSGGALAVAPEGPGRFGIEPLCAWYACAALPALEERLARGERSAGRLLLDLGADRIPLATVRGLGNPEVLFHNVNTREDRLTAERIARAAGRTDVEA